MTAIEWEINDSSALYMTPNGDISIKLQVNDIVCLQYNGCEYEVSVKEVDLSGESEGNIKNYRFISEKSKIVADTGASVNFSFNQIFSIER